MMSTTNKELLHTQMHVEELSTDNKESGKEEEQLIDREKIDGTPFWVEGTKEKGYYLRMGRHRLTIEEIKTKEEAIEYINYNMYDLLLKMVLAVMSDREEINWNDKTKTTKTN